MSDPVTTPLPSRIPFPRPGELLGSPGSLVATAALVGLCRPGPGTWASLVTAILAALALPLLPPWGMAGAAIIATLMGVWAAGVEIRRSGLADPSWVVIDEVAGVLTGLALVPPAVAQASPFVAALLVFLLFRVYDIAKPWPISRLEHLPGGWGVMADDVLAGAVAGLLTAAFLR